MASEPSVIITRWSEMEYAWTGLYVSTDDDVPGTAVYYGRCTCVYELTAMLFICLRPGPSQEQVPMAANCSVEVQAGQTGPASAAGESGAQQALPVVVAGTHSQSRRQGRLTEVSLPCISRQQGTFPLPLVSSRDDSAQQPQRWPGRCDCAVAVPARNSKSGALGNLPRLSFSYSGPSLREKLAEQLSGMWVHGSGRVPNAPCARQRQAPIFSWVSRVSCKSRPASAIWSSRR